ncbi:MAG: phage terminase large subunit [Bacillota bacterium]
MLLGEYLMKVERGEILRLIVEMPPRHGKSETTSVKFPAFYSGKHPDRRIILASHTASLAARFSMRARNDFNAFAPSVWGLEGLEVNPDVSAMYRWDVSDPNAPRGRPPGGMLAAGIGGPITGQGAHLAIIDDPIKDAETANSKLQRDAIWDWYRFVLRTRLFPGAAVILVLTRWHEDDLAGRLLKQSKEDPEADQWTVLRLPAIAEDPKDAEDGEEVKDPLGRPPGKALWPEQYDEKALTAVKATVGSYVWAALYQQRPSPAEGNILKRDWWKFYRQAPEDFDEIIQSWDCAFKDKDDSDFVVGQVWGRKKADKYVLDQVRGRMSFPATLTAIRTLTGKWPKARAKLVEDKANGTAVIATLKHEIPGLIAIEPEGGKIVRARAVSPDIEAGNVYLPDPSIAPWVHDFIEEATAFPNGANDDQVDAATQALVWFGVAPVPLDDKTRRMLQEAKFYV